MTYSEKCPPDNLLGGAKFAMGDRTSMNGISNTHLFWYKWLYDAIVNGLPVAFLHASDTGDVSVIVSSMQFMDYSLVVRFQWTECDDKTDKVYLDLTSSQIAHLCPRASTRAPRRAMVR